MNSCLKCQHCDKIFKENRILREHIKFFHDGINLPPCHRSGRKPRIIENGETKQRTILKCFYCEKFFYCKSSVIRHIKLTHAKSDSAKIENKSLKQHKTCSNKSRRSSITCTECKKTFNYQSSLKRHIKISHILPKQNLLTTNEQNVTRNEDDFNIDFEKGNIHISMFHEKNIKDSADGEDILVVKAEPKSFLSDNDCCKCGKSFNLKKYADRHMFKVHKIKPLVRTTIHCPLCPVTVQNRYKLNDHLSNIHNVVPSLRELKFDSMNAFKKWKEEIEKFTTSFYYLSNTKKSKNSKKYIFTCNRSGKYLPKLINRKRKVKIHGHRKTIQTCPAFIHAIHSVNENVNVTFCETHIGHIHDSNHLNQSHTLRKIFATECKKIPQCHPVRKVITKKSEIAHENETIIQIKSALDAEFSNLLNACSSTEELSFVEQNIMEIYPALNKFKQKVEATSQAISCQSKTNLNKKTKMRNKKWVAHDEQVYSNFLMDQVSDFNEECYTVENNENNFDANCEQSVIMNRDIYQSIDVQNISIINAENLTFPIDGSTYRIANLNTIGNNFDISEICSNNFITNLNSDISKSAEETIDLNTLKNMNHLKIVDIHSFSNCKDLIKTNLNVSSINPTLNDIKTIFSNNQNINSIKTCKTNLLNEHYQPIENLKG